MLRKRKVRCTRCKKRMRAIAANSAQVTIVTEDAVGDLPMFCDRCDKVVCGECATAGISSHDVDGFVITCPACSQSLEPYEV